MLKTTLFSILNSRPVHCFQNLLCSALHSQWLLYSTNSVRQESGTFEDKAVINVDNPGDQLRSTLSDEVSTTDNVFMSKFPTTMTHSTLHDGVQFDMMPVAYVKATYNNTIISICDETGKTVIIESAGTVGFRNARKGTTVAAQAVGISAAEKAVKKGIDTVRLNVRGIGPGRFSAIKALQMSGLTIISLTDSTRLPSNGCRPKKQRRI